MAFVGLARVGDRLLLMPKTRLQFIGCNRWPLAPFPLGHGFVPGSDPVIVQEFTKKFLPNLMLSPQTYYEAKLGKTILSNRTGV